jgi:polyhydroxybutyrate depolymerase
MKKLFLAFTIALFSLNTTSSQIKKSVFHDKHLRTWLTHLPENYQESKSYPLVIALHGGNGKAKKFNKSTKGRFNKLSNKEEFIVVYPQGIDKSWNDNSKRNLYGEARTQNIDDVGFIAKMISTLESKYSIDSAHIFACGISNGGLMSATLATKLPNKIKAIGMVSSNFSKVHYEEMQAETPQPFSIIIIQGTQDPIFPYTEGEISFFKQRRGHIIGAEKSIAFMNKLNGNSSEGIETELENYAPFDGCKSTHIVYPNDINPNLKVELIKIVGGGHTWPGGHQYLPKKIIGAVTRDFNAADKLWKFFKSTMD